MKKKYQITFYAELDESDVNAMKSVFYDAMKESMNIDECWGLNVLDAEKAKIDIEKYDIVLKKDDYEFNDYEGGIKIKKQIFNDYKENAAIDIYFVDEIGEPIMTYVMFREDENYIYCKYFVK